ncbi:3-oxoacyl-ACP synthase [Aquimarina sp. MMG016]|uniref:3-oxoacyl-ACP synthase n=1 Tax=Aquimarina sp. MMG016 TaxID=2822690 RepID=UPI001B3A1C55|nr:3-oxoacyl-ACP synthase [Aquimarina sp. MMG016]MBQ4821341.1 3-oxoacyl-ACP synthase [Aquimarina sp. MMG016]
MEQQYYITSFCSIKNNKISKNGELLYSDDNSDSIKDFAKGIYKFLELKYPKFHKMDELCKLSFLASEVLLSDQLEVSEDTALVLANRASSLDTDRKHQDTIKDRENYFPSPAVFVYTLPNIMMGEISIRHQLKSENAFFVKKAFDAKFLTTYSRVLLDTNKASNVICGWVDLDNDKYDVFLAFISRNGEKLLSKEQLNNFYKS